MDFSVGKPLISHYPLQMLPGSLSATIFYATTTLIASIPPVSLWPADMPPVIKEDEQAKKRAKKLDKMYQ